MKTIILKNTTISDILVYGRVITALGQRDISDIPAVVLREDSGLITAIQSGDIVVNNGTNDLSVTNGELYISYGYSLTIKVNGVAVTPPVSYISTLNFKGGAVIIDEGSGTISIESGEIAEIQKDDVAIVTDVDKINFEGDVTVVDDTGGKATITIGSFLRTVVTSASYTILSTDDYIGVDFAGDVTLTMPTGIEGKRITVKDESGKASINKIVVNASGADTIDKKTTFSIAIDFGAIQMVFGGTEWHII